GGGFSAAGDFGEHLALVKIQKGGGIGGMIGDQGKPIADESEVDRTAIRLGRRLAVSLQHTAGNKNAKGSEAKFHNTRHAGPSLSASEGHKFTKALRWRSGSDFKR